MGLPITRPPEDEEQKRGEFRRSNRGIENGTVEQARTTKSREPDNQKPTTQSKGDKAERLQDNQRAKGEGSRSLI